MHFGLKVLGLGLRYGIQGCLGFRVAVRDLGFRVDGTDLGFKVPG